MWERFTQSARRCILYAQWEAERCGTRFVCSEHLLLGLCREATSRLDKQSAKSFTLAERMRRLVGRSAQEQAHCPAHEPDSGLARLGINWQLARAQVERSALRGIIAGDDMQLSRRARRILELAYDEARQMAQPGIAPEHLLLGIVREREGMGARTLLRMGVELEALRRWVREPQCGMLLRGADSPGAKDDQLLHPACHESDEAGETLLRPMAAKEDSNKP